VPGNKYSISVVSNLIERTVPLTHNIDMGTDDIKGFDFLAIMQSPFIEISGSVDFQDEDSNLVFREDPRAVVEIYEEGTFDAPIQTQTLTLSRYFQFNFLPRKDYYIRIVPKRGANDRRYDAATFKAHAGFQGLIVQKRSKQSGDVNRAGLLGPFAIATLIFLFFYQD